MNAYELADILHQSDFLAMDFAEDAATMLRQQADRIALYELFIAERGETGAFIVWSSKKITE